MSIKTSYDWRDVSGVMSENSRIVFRTCKSLIKRNTDEEHRWRGVARNANGEGWDVFDYVDTLDLNQEYIDRLDRQPVAENVTLEEALEHCRVFDLKSGQSLTGRSQEELGALYYKAYAEAQGIDLATLPMLEEPFMKGVLVSDKSVSIQKPIEDDAIIFADGPVEVEEAKGDLTIFTTGPVKVGKAHKGLVVITLDEIEVGSMQEKSVLYTKKSIKFDTAHDTVYGYMGDVIEFQEAPKVTGEPIGHSLYNEIYTRFRQVYDYSTANRGYLFHLLYDAMTVMHFDSVKEDLAEEKKSSVERWYGKKEGDALRDNVNEMYKQTLQEKNEIIQKKNNNESLKNVFNTASSGIFKMSNELKFNKNSNLKESKELASRLEALDEVLEDANSRSYRRRELIGLGAGKPTYR